MEKLNNVVDMQANVKTCNKCGKIYRDGSNPYWDSEIQAFIIQFGYGSDHDLEIWKFDLCDKCLEKLVKSFKIPVEVEEVTIAL